MASKTNIEWTATYHEDGTVTKGFNWNFLRGCSRVSEGCRNCYAERQAARFAGEGQPYEGLVRSTSGGPKWTGEISFHEHILLEPLKRKTPTKYFVNSMSDLFHEKVTDEMLDKAFAVMALTPQHTYQILTKRPERMREYVESLKQYEFALSQYWLGDWVSMGIDRVSYQHLEKVYVNKPLPNVHLGVSVEDQKTANDRIPLLLDTPAAVHWVSYEPALGPIDHAPWLAHGLKPGHGMKWRRFVDDAAYEQHFGFKPLPYSLDWIVLGGESGPNARPFDIAWARSVIEQCKAADVPVFVKQLGAKPYFGNWAACGQVPYSTIIDDYDADGNSYIHTHDKKGGDPSEWPEDLRVREFPTIGRTV